MISRTNVDLSKLKDRVIETKYLVEFAQRWLPGDNDLAKEYRMEIITRLKEWGFYKELLKGMVQEVEDK